MRTWFLAVADALRARALHWAMQGRIDIAERMIELAEIEEAKAHG